MPYSGSYLKCVLRLGVVGVKPTNTWRPEDFAWSSSFGWGKIFSDKITSNILRSKIPILIDIMLEQDYSLLTKHWFYRVPGLNVVIPFSEFDALPRQYHRNGIVWIYYPYLPLLKINTWNNAVKLILPRPNNFFNTPYQLFKRNPFVFIIIKHSFEVERVVMSISVFISPPAILHNSCYTFNRVLDGFILFFDGKNPSSALSSYVSSNITSQSVAKSFLLIE